MLLALIYFAIGLLLIAILDHGLDDVGNVLFFICLWPFCLLFKYLGNDNKYKQ